MDAFHKVLIRIYEITGGRENQDVDFVELLKAEGFYPSLESIKGHMSTESWITDSPRPNSVRITHWGISEAKKTLASPQAAEAGIDRTTARLSLVTRDFAIVVEEFISKPSKKSLQPVQDRLTELESLVSKIKSMV
jgi:hypothetical protein